MYRLKQKRAGLGTVSLSRNLLQSGECTVRMVRGGSTLSEDGNIRVTWEEVRAEAELLVNDAVSTGAKLRLTEYKNKQRYEKDHPRGRSFADHNLVVRATMREASRRGIDCRRRLIA
jgi:hypothetical protein